MRIDSCRKCGSDLEISQNCSICSEGIKFSCKNCHAHTDERFHLTCTIISFDYNLLKQTVA